MARIACCDECGKDIEVRARPKRFCSDACRWAWTNRRKDRGSQIYDLFMNSRFNRKEASDKGVWAIMCRMASNWKHEDDENNRRSFAGIQDVLESNVQHVATRHRASKRGR